MHFRIEITLILELHKLKRERVGILKHWFAIMCGIWKRISVRTDYVWKGNSYPCDEYLSHVIKVHICILQNLVYSSIKPYIHQERIRSHSLHSAKFCSTTNFPPSGPILQKIVRPLRSHTLPSGVCFGLAPVFLVLLKITRP